MHHQLVQRDDGHGGRGHLDAPGLGRALPRAGLPPGLDQPVELRREPGAPVPGQGGGVRLRGTAGHLLGGPPEGEGQPDEVVEQAGHGGVLAGRRVPELRVAHPGRHAPELRGGGGEVERRRLHAGYDRATRDALIGCRVPGRRGAWGP